MTSGKPLRSDRWPSTRAKSRSWIASDLSCRTARSTVCRPPRTSRNRSVTRFGLIRANATRFGQQFQRARQDQIGGEYFVAVVAPVKRAEASGGETALGVARQTDFDVRREADAVKGLFCRRKVVRGRDGEHGTIRQGETPDHHPAAEGFGAHEPRAFVLAQRSEEHTSELQSRLHL